MFRWAHRSSSGALNCIWSLWFICPYGDRPLPRLSGHTVCPLNLGKGRSPYGHINQRLQIQFRALDDDRCAALNMLSILKKPWNNKFYYKAASGWYFYWVIYDARIHEGQSFFFCQIMNHNLFKLYYKHCYVILCYVMLCYVVLCYCIKVGNVWQFFLC